MRRLFRTDLATLAALASLAGVAPLAAQAHGEPSAVIDPSCDRACQVGLVRRHMQALEARDPSALPVSDALMFTENNVALPLGKGL